MKFLLQRHIRPIFPRSSIVGAHVFSLREIENCLLGTDRKLYKDGKKLHRKYLVQLMIAAKEILSAKPSLVDLTVEEGGKLTVCGDTHGQFFDLMNIFNLNGVP